ncbi:MAG: DUF3618 domain-containing protein [Streptosporangiales bacterium]|nr:DUF3618 domain-containing protein [Streptosporangiales bacterium]
MSDAPGSPSELERQIERARTDLARSVDAIVDRVHPKRVLERGMGRLKQRVGGATAQLEAAADHDPHGTHDGGPVVRKEYLIAAAAVVVVGTAAIIVWRRRR